MNKLQEIESKLKAINDAVFQNLCDAYLYFTEKGYPEIDRTGSQKGKQKTVKGTPDSYYQLPNGKYVLIEYTTKEKNGSQKSFLEKIKDDVGKCLNSEITGLKVDDIQKIIYCCNSSIALKERKKLEDYCADKRVKLDIRTIDKIALSLLGRGMYVAKEFLGVNVDTAQVLTPQTFKVEYEANGYATPLTNTFLYREQELESLNKALDASQICILTGPPGVGKSRLAMAAIESREELKAATVYCLSNKTAPIYEDLRLYLTDDKSYVVLVDDANRQVGNLDSVIALLREHRTHKLHIIITVRDYALNEVKARCAPLVPEVISVPKLTDEQIDGLLLTSDFNIRNSRYRKRIVEIADGNPRLAIMAAKLAIEKQDINVLNDVSKLYDAYFENALGNTNVFADRDLLKTMSLIAFFYSLNLEDKKFIGTICRDFGIKEEVLITSAERLERLELLESSPDFSIIRMPEQVLSTYFFYRGFFKDGLLDFTVILEKYFSSYLHRIRDTVLPANNTFGYENVYKRIDPFLNRFWQIIKEDTDQAFKFLELFWFYRQDDALAFVNEAILKMAPVHSAVFNWDDKQANNLYGSKRDRYIDLLSKFYSQDTEQLADAIDLSYEYTRRNPKVYNQLIKSIRDGFVFSADDEMYSFVHQKQLLDFLIKKAKRGNRLSIAMFFDIVPEMMKTSHHVVSGGRKKHSISFYQYELPLTTEIKNLRKKVWEFLQENFKRFSERIAMFMKEYAQRTPDKVKTIYSYDLPFVLCLFDTHFDPEQFSHAYAVQNLIFWFRRVGVRHKDFDNLKKRFFSDAYRVYSLISRDKIRGKEEFEFENHEEYDRLKEAQLRKNFSFKDLRAFQNFYSVFEELDAWEGKSQSPFWWSFDIILDQQFSQSFSHGINCLEHVIKRKNKVNHVPSRAFNRIMSDSTLKQRNAIFSFILRTKFEQRFYWIQQYFRLAPQSDLRSDHAKILLSSYQEYSGRTRGDFSFMSKFNQVSQNLPVSLLELIINKNEKEEGKILLDWNFFEDYFDLFSHRADLLKRAYFSQDNLEQHFDHDSKDFFQILQMDRGFLTEYVDHYLKHSFSLSTRDHTGMSIIWQLPEAESMLAQLFDHLTEANTYFFREHFCNVFFEHLSEENNARAIKLLQAYLKKHKSDTKRLNMVFDCVRHSFAGHLEPFLLHFLSINSRFEDFKEIELLDSYFFGNGNVIWADVRAKQLTDILSIFERIKVKPYRFAKHKQYLKDSINAEKRQADWERLQNFMRNE